MVQNTLLRQKYYQYKISSPSAVYLGLLQNVISDYTHNLIIGSAFVQTQITVGQSPDLVTKPTTPILDENSQPILDEAGNQLLDEGANDIIGSNNPNALIACNNLIQVYEYSSYYPNGLLVFSGYISKWKAVFGSAENIVLTCISNGQDLNNYLVLGGNTIDQSQLTQNASIIAYEPGRGAAIQNPGQTFTTGATITALTAISAIVAAQLGSDPQQMQIALYNAPNGTLIASSNFVTVSSTSPAEVVFSFPSSVVVTPNTQYFFAVYAQDAIGAYIYYNTAGGYAGGNMWLSSYGGAGGSANFFQNPPYNGYSLYFKTWWVSAPNSVPFTNADPSTILTTIINSYIAAGGLVSLPVAGLSPTGVLTTYTFKTQIMLQGINTLIGLAPANWYWYVDPATNIIQFAKANTVADIVLIKGRHINDLDIEATRENIKNNVYFTGGDDGTGQSHNIFVQIQNALNGNRVGLALLSDNRVNSTSGSVTTARQIAQEYINDNNAETYITNVTIQDGTIDTNLFKPGKMIGFAGFSPFINNLLLQVVGVQKSSDKAILQLGTLPIRTSQALANIEAGLAYQQTVANPATPS